MKLIAAYAGIAGKGPGRWLWGVFQILYQLAQERGAKFVYAGPELEVDGLVMRPSLGSEIRIADASVAQKYAATEEALRNAIGSSRKIVVVAVGYTAYVPYAIDRIARPGSKTRLLVLDSSPPDTDEKSEAVEDDGQPASRFYWPAYNSTAGVHKEFVLCSTYDYPVGLVESRIPKGMSSRVIAHPFPMKYIQQLQDVPQAYGEKDTVAVICAGSYWGRWEEVSPWMTREQYETMATGTQSLLAGIATAQDLFGRRLRVRMDQAGFEFAKQRGILPNNLQVQPFSDLPHEEHLRLMAQSAVVIGRGGNQTNSLAAATIMGVPFIVWDVPGERYMQTGATNHVGAKKELFPILMHDASPQEIARRILGELRRSPDQRTVIGERLRQEMFSLPILRQAVMEDL
ncbi:MAG: hypothetical protein COU10_03555 [Candidatus Harrisonbacteria bacterium CG10_big_fil_rev_8_21_14_0_10_45_28]|uniref:Uncharacterized protein n=1 Tax=Candidatus Harrisonbacteria bacterium CG10_big_fil_rev_8_21_14_0_10_45_28 TaxID=1974586 RepID=A0A2H0UMK4_9BACT|nr:MAG: hypothetical protein COU10_03555 [Candidatus Harrisonbacteria bacterium CG10_big_fil_rev_8_21_14_0_10_45_28]